jgi:hypothetical protein
MLKRAGWCGLGGAVKTGGSSIPTGAIEITFATIGAGDNAR